MRRQAEYDERANRLHELFRRSIGIEYDELSPTWSPGDKDPAEGFVKHFRACHGDQLAEYERRVKRRWAGPFEKYHPQTLYEIHLLFHSVN